MLAYKAYLASTRVKIFAHFYRNMTAVQRFEVNGSLLLNLLMLAAINQLDHTQTAAIVAMASFIGLTLYLTFYVICQNFRMVYLQLYLDYGEKMEFHADTYVRYLAFINQLRIHNLYMVDDLRRIIEMIKAELDSKHITYPLLTTLPRLFTTVLFTLLVGSLLYIFKTDLPHHPALAWIVIMVALLMGTGLFARYRKSIQLLTLKKFCRWAISDIEYETDFDGIEEEFD